MPQKGSFSVEDYNDFIFKLYHIGFRKLSVGEFKKEFVRLGLIAPRPIEGREAGFIFDANKIKVIVWTTWLENHQTIRESDSGWVVVKQDDEAHPVYFSGPYHRTQNFFLNLYRNAWLAWFRAINRPICSKCKQWMKIHRGKAMKSRYWICSENDKHPDKLPIFLDWDFGLPQRAKDFLKKKRKIKAKRIARLIKEGKEPYSALKKRKPWIITRPENLP